MPDDVRPSAIEVAEAFVREYGDASDVYQQLDRYLQTLKFAGWPVLDVTEVQLLVIERMTG